MSRPTLEAELDPLLEPLLAAVNESQTERALTDLFALHADGRIREITGYKLRPWTRNNVTAADVEDVCSDIRLQLLTRLRAFKTDPVTHSIRNFRSYVAITALRACYDHLRRKYPQRYALKHRVRYALNQHPQLACWQVEPEVWLCGLSAWSADSSLRAISSGQMSELRTRPETFALAALPKGTPQGVPLPQLLLAFFNWTEQPVELDELVSLIAALLGIRDTMTESTEAEENSRLALESLPAANLNKTEELEQQRYLAQLWAELQAMPARHRAAVLLNLRDDHGGSALDLFLFTSIATLAQLADALEMTRAELLELWNHLPLDDATIAERLGLRRQQIINLRQTARERLRRRLREAGF